MDVKAALGPAWAVCLAEAWEAYRAGSNPIGACVVDPDGAVLAAARNRIGERAASGAQLAGNRLAHAEVNALLEAAAWPGEPRALTLYTTTEPCPLCCGAIVMANVRSVRYAARDPWAGSAVLFEATPYLRGKDVRATGPHDPRLELVVKVLAVDHMLRSRAPRAPEVIAAIGAMLPRAVAIARELHREDALPALAAAGAPVEAALACVLERADHLVH